MNFEEKIKRAFEKKRAFQLEDAARLFKEASEERPGDIKAASEAGFCFFLMGRSEDALPLFQKAFENSKEGDVVLGVYVLCCLVCLEETEKSAAFLPALRQKEKEQGGEENIPEAVMTCSEILGNARKYKEALDLIDFLSRKFAGETWFSAPRNLYRLITALAACGEVEVSAQMAKDLASAIPEEWAGWGALGQVALAMNDYKNSYSYLKKAILLGGDQEPLLAAVFQKVALEQPIGAPPASAAAKPKNMEAQAIKRSLDGKKGGKKGKK